MNAERPGVCPPAAPSVPGSGALQVGPDWVLGRARDELDVEYVRLHPLRRS